jgi:hypothetical protein
MFNRDIKPSEINDTVVMRCFLDNDEWFRSYFQILYCESPKILDENNECALEIDSEEWKNVIGENLIIDDDKMFIYLKHDILKKSRKVFRKRYFSLGNSKNIFAAVGKTPEDKYEMFEMETCLDIITQLAKNELYTIDAKSPSNISTMEFLLLHLHHNCCR